MVAAVVDRFGRLDVIVNDAGVHEGGDPACITDEKWFYGCRAALPHLEKTKGSIVNTASVSGTGGDWGMSPYNAAKGAVVNLTRALALDLGKKGIRVNAVCPSLRRTGMTEDMMDDKELLAKFAERIPLGRVCEPEEVLAVIAFLASEDARFMTGANVSVDGGVVVSGYDKPRDSVLITLKAETTPRPSSETLPRSSFARRHVQKSPPPPLRRDSTE